MQSANDAVWKAGVRLLCLDVLNDCQFSIWLFNGKYLDTYYFLSSSIVYSLLSEQEYLE